MKPTDSHIYLQDRRGEVTGLPDGPVTCVAVDSRRRIWAGTPDGLFMAEEEGFTLLFRPIPFVSGPVEALGTVALEDSVEIYAQSADGLFYFPIDDDPFTLQEELDPNPPLITYAEAAAQTAFGRQHTMKPALLSGMSELGFPGPSAQAHDMTFDGSWHRWIATSEGVFIWLPGDHQETITPEDGLPLADVRRIALAEDGTRWFGLAQGVARMRDGQWRYFAGKRWLPDDTVTDMASDGQGGLFVATPSGLGWIAAEPMTLEEKARRFQIRLRERHCRHGYVSNSILQTPGDPESYLHEASDNDGLWTALYVASECYRYQITGDLQAKVNACESMAALERLELVTSLSGFPARAMVLNEDRVHRSDYGTGGEWHPIADGSGEWKGDTSSDELDGHFFACSVVYETIDDPEWKSRVAAYAARIADHLIQNDFNLIDLDGEHTRWGFFSPSILNSDKGRSQRGLNSLEILSHLKTAYHLTGEARFQEAYLHLVRDHHYALNIVRQKVITSGHVNHSDDELAFLAYYPLLRFETDPDLLALYRWSLRRSWEAERPERSPFFNVLYGASMSGPCDRDVTRQALEEIPLDIISWRMENSHRADLEHDDKAGRFNEPQSKTALSPAERPMLKWNGNPYRMDGGADGREEEDGAFFLLPYWMGRAFDLL